MWFFDSFQNKENVIFDSFQNKENVIFWFFSGQTKCDFDDGFSADCVLQQDDSDDFDFTLRIGSTPSRYTGPDADHTTGRMGMTSHTLIQTISY